MKNRCTLGRRMFFRFTINIKYNYTILKPRVVDTHNNDSDVAVLPSPLTSSPPHLHLLTYFPFCTHTSIYILSMAAENIINVIAAQDQALLMSAASVDDVILDSKVSSYDSAVKSFSNWFFNVLQPEQRGSYGYNLLSQTDKKRGYFDISDKDAFIKSLETTQKCCFYDYCLWKRRTHYITKKALGIGHFSHLSAAISNKLASQPNVKTISDIGKVVRTKFLKGL